MRDYRDEDEDYEDEPDRYSDDDDEDEDDGPVSSGLEKAITIGGFLIGAVIIIILIVVIGNMAGLFGSKKNKDADSSASSVSVVSTASETPSVLSASMVFAFSTIVPMPAIIGPASASRASACVSESCT